MSVPGPRLSPRADSSKDAVIDKNRAPIAKYGRFLKPILARILASSTAAETAIVYRNLSFAYTAASPAPGGCR